MTVIDVAHVYQECQTMTQKPRLAKLLERLLEERADLCRTHDRRQAEQEAELRALVADIEDQDQVIATVRALLNGPPVVRGEERSEAPVRRLDDLPTPTGAEPVVSVPRNPFEVGSLKWYCVEDRFAWVAAGHPAAFHYRTLHERVGHQGTPPWKKNSVYDALRKTPAIFRNDEGGYFTFLLGAIID